MNTAVRYFAYHFKKTIVRLIILAFFISLMSYYTSVYLWTSVEYADVDFSSLTVILVIVTYVVAVMELAPFKNRRNLDLWLSSPLSRTQLLAAHLINGAAHLIITLFFAGSFAAIRIAVLNSMGADFYPSYGFHYAAVMIPALLLTYIIACSIYILGNRSMDGVIFLILYTILPFLINGAIESLRLDRIGIRYRAKYTFSWLEIPFDLASKEQRSAMGKVDMTLVDSIYITQFAVLCVVWTVIAIGALVLTVVYFKRLKPEKIGGPSDVFPGYRFLLPASAYSMIILSADSYLVVPLFILIGMFLMYIVFRKSVRIKIPDIICLGVGVVIMIISRFNLW